MSKAMQLVGIFLLGVFTLAIIYLMSDVRSTNELDYYLLQEVTEASMYDAVDYSYYRETGLISVDRDMFLESFNRRFAESVENDRDYTIKIIDFNETPPKVSVEVSAPTVASVKGEVAIVTNRVNGIIETIYDDFVYSRGDYRANNYDNRRPEIKLISQSGNSYELEMSDNYGLRRYAVIEAESDDNFLDDVYNSVEESDWIDIYPKEYLTKKTITESIANNKRGFWVIIEDLSGLWAGMPITDTDPWFDEIKVIAEGDAKGTPGNLKVVFKDYEGLSSYKVDSISCNGTVNKDEKNGYTCTTDWTTKKAGNPISITDAVLVEKDKSYTKTVYDIVISDAPYYRLTVTDTGGHSVTKIIEGRKIHSINILQQITDDNKLRITITDTYDDLSAYQVTNSSDADNSKWITITGGSKVVDLDNPPQYNGYYIHVKDTSGKTAKQQITTKTTWTYAYTGGIQEFTATVAGTYKLEVWGAQGGSVTSSGYTEAGGYGGYSYGNISLSKGQKLYVVVGGTTKNSTGGYNGGGSCTNTAQCAGGGGATHIATASGTLSTLEKDKQAILIVAGGGGGGGGSHSLEIATSYKPVGGAGGGQSGQDAYATGPNKDNINSIEFGKGGTQSSGGTSAVASISSAANGSFGLGGTGQTDKGGGGGGGYFGGGSGGNYNGGMPGGGGSGYTGGVTGGDMDSGKQSGDGYAKITLISAD